MLMETKDGFTSLFYGKERGGNMANKKISRKQVFGKPDRFVVFSNRLLEFAIKYKIQISCVAGVIFAFIIIISGMQYFANKAENEVFTMLAKCIFRYETIMKENAPDKAYEDKAYADVEKDFDFILEKYSKTDGGKLARVIYADFCYNAGNFDKAITLYNKALSDFDNNQSFKTLVLSGLGYSYEEKKDYKQATNYFKMIVSEPDSIIKDEAFFNLGRLYAAMGENDKSKDAFKKIISDYTDSIYIELVEEIAG